MGFLIFVIIAGMLGLVFLEKLPFDKEGVEPDHQIATIALAIIGTVLVFKTGEPV